MLRFRNLQRDGIFLSRMDRMAQDLSRTGAGERDVEQVLFHIFNPFVMFPRSYMFISRFRKRTRKKTYIVCFNLDLELILLSIASLTSCFLDYQVRCSRWSHFCFGFYLFR